MIYFYCGINEDRWNKHRVTPGQLACVSPVYGASKRTKTENRVPTDLDTDSIIQDGGPFCDGPDERLSFEDALKRQITHAAKYKYAHKIEAVASYDLLIDEKWNGGKRHKARWTKSEAEAAVTETINAARYYSEHRYAIPYEPHLVLSAQGVTVEQYRRCTINVLDYAEPSDYFGMGGWCITGRMRAQILPAFYLISEAIMPIVARRVKRVHIWGVLLAEALGPLLWLCDQHELTLSTDSAGPQLKPARFGDWGYAEWRDPGYKKYPVETRGLERARHVQKTREWLANFRDTQWYRPPYTYEHYPPNNRLQMVLF